MCFGRPGSESSKKRCSGGKTVIVRIAGPVFEPTGYANLVRRLALGLDARGIRVSLIPMRWGDAPDGLDTPVRDRLFAMTGAGPSPDISLHVGPPEIFPPGWRAGRTALFTMLESDRIPEHWVITCNRYDEVWVPTRFNRNTFAASGVSSHRIFVQPLGVDTQTFVPPPRGARPHRPFTFLSVFEWIPRKGYRLLIPAFADALSGEEARLLLKVQNNAGFDPTGSRIRSEIEALCSATGCRDVVRQIDVVHGILTEAEMAGLYQKADCFVLPSSGEGWCFPIIEAVAAGLPVITTDWSGPLDYLRPEWTYMIPVKGVAPVEQSGAVHARVYEGSRWASPDSRVLTDHLRGVFADPTTAFARAEAQRQAVIRDFSWEAVIDQVIARFRIIAPPRQETGRMSGWRRGAP